MKYLMMCLYVAFILSKSHERDFITYHQEYNHIENLIVDENFEEAEFELNKLLNSYRPPFAKDYVIAAEICLLNNNKGKAIDWIKESMRHGVKIDCLKSIGIFEEKLTYFHWKKLEKDYQNLRKEYQSKISIGASKLFHRNYQKEQLSKMERNYKGIVYSNFYKIKEFADYKTYPGENLIGIDDSNDAQNIDDCEFDNSKVTVTLLHMDFPVNRIQEKKLIEAIENGSLHPREFAIIYTFQKSRISKLYKTSGKLKSLESDYNFQFPYEKRKGDSVKVNQDRSKFGICSLETDKKKTEVEKKYKLKLNFGYR